jgi:cell division septation protein DedD
MRGPDVVLLRVPRAGGRVTAALYPRLDSIVWRSRENAPPLARVLAFDADAGLVAAVDTGGLPVRVDLRLGTVRKAGRAPLTALAALGGTFYGVTADGAVTRLTAAGQAWAVRLRPTPQALFPQRDGSVLATAASGGTGMVWVLRPPTATATDSVRVAGGARPVRLDATDRVYFTGGDELIAVQARTLAPAPAVALGAGVRTAASSPSGDRLFVLTERGGEVRVVDRYAGREAPTLQLPGDARELRVDPLGRYLLARPARGDSAWVVAVGTGRVIGVAGGTWRTDLPLVLPDGAILTASGADVAIVDGETLRPRATVPGGAADFWHVVAWNGLRPRAAGLDQPATFERPGDRSDTAEPDSAAPSGDTATPAADTTAGPPPAPVESTAMEARARPTTPEIDLDFTAARVVASAGGEVLTSQPPAAASRVSRPPGRARGTVYTVQFAAAASEREARRALARLRVPGAALRVVPRVYDGQTVYRVVAGPFATRAEAERVGRTAGPGNFWVYGGAP